MMVDYHHDMVGFFMDRQYFAILLLTKNYLNGYNPIYGKSEIDF